MSVYEHDHNAEELVSAFMSAIICVIRGNNIDMRTGPDYIQFYPTLRCNQSCEFCFNRSMPFLPDMSSGDFSVMLDQISALKVRTLDIIGGEPTLHSQIVGLVRQAVQHGLNVNVSSNGTNLDVLEELARIGGQVAIGISVNDRESLDHAADFIQKNRVIVKSIFAPTIDKEFIHEILSLQPKRYYLIYRDVMDSKDLHAVIPFYQYISLVEELFSPRQVGTVYCSGFIPDSENYPELARVRCPAGTTKLGIMPDGSVYPCNLFFGKKEFLLGNILTDPFESIWEHPTLVFFRAAVQNGCPETNCALHTRCRGGCPAHSIAHSCRLSAPDPRCSREENIIEKV
jgi:radical SAM protein with 4Fe4S-binding SPASM domain